MYNMEFNELTDREILIYIRQYPQQLIFNTYTKDRYNKIITETPCH